MTSWCGRARLLGIVSGALVLGGCGNGASGAGGSGGATSAATGPTGTTSTQASVTSTTTGAGGQGGAPDADVDGDGLGDAYEAKAAADYMPFLSVDPADNCPLRGVVYRVRPHPSDPTKLHIIYDVLYQNDCGANGHLGDDEVFAVTIDPMFPPPNGIVAVRAIGHQNTPCQVITDCGSCSGLTACNVAGTGADERPVVYSSTDKHANYADLSKCTIFSCLASCTTAPSEPAIPMVNAGEPTHHLVSNLTTEGFITQANGWTEMTLFDFDPWVAMTNFGGAGNIASDLDDAAFLTPVCAGM